MIRKNPGFSLVAVLTLALGIGANTAIFSVVDALLLRPLPLREPDRLVTVTGSNPKRVLTGIPLSVAAYETARDRSQSFTGVAAFTGDGFTLTGSAEPELLAAGRVSPNYFEVVGARPLKGRGFAAAEGEPGGQPVAIISHKLWQRRFASDPKILGKPLPLDQSMYTIIGVMPADFPFPVPGLDVWVTKVSEYGGLAPEQIQMGAGFLTAVARLKPGVSTERAEAELTVLYKQYRNEHPTNPDADPNARYDAVALQEGLVAGIRSTLLLLTAAVAFVLMIACANVASLTMARATGRAREIALRAALGASRRNIVEQLMTESLLLAGAGAIVGVVLAYWGVTWLAASNNANLPGFEPIRVDLRVLLFTLVVSLLTGAAFGLMPALQVSRPDLNGVLRDSGWGTTSGGRRRRTRAILVAGQMALSIVLLIGAGLLIQSFRRIQTVDPGFDPQHALTMSLNLPPTKYATNERRTEFFRAVLERLSQVPGVRHAAAAMSLPLATRALAPMLPEGQPNVPNGQRPLAIWNAITPDYFQTLGTPIVAGRTFTWADDAKAPRVCIVSESIVHRFFPDRNPIGMHIAFTRRGVNYEIVGVAADVKTRTLDADSGMVFYTAYPQFSWPGMSITVRTAGDPRAMLKTAAAQVYAVDRDQPVTNVQTLEDFLSGTLSQRRETMYLIAGFAVVALLLALIGLYGVMAYSVAQRTNEIGIRQAIGAQRSDILRMVLRQGVLLSAAGIAAGSVAALGITRMISGMLFHVSATDPATFAEIAALFLVVAVAATVVPAWRATRVDPVEALRGR